MKSFAERALVASVLFLFAWGAVQAQHPLPGNPLAEIYRSRDHGISSPHTYLAKDQLGRIYVSGSIGDVARFDGTKWTQVLPGTRWATLGGDSRGTVYVGTVSDFGYLKNLADGDIRYESLKPLFAAADASLFGDVHNVLSVDEGVYLTTSSSLFFVSADLATGWRVDLPGDASGHRVFPAGGRLFYWSPDQGLLEVSGRSFKAIPGGEAFRKAPNEESAARAVYGLVARSDDFVLVAKDGAYRYAQGRIERMSTAPNGFSPSCRVLVFLPGTGYLQSCFDGQMRRYNESLELIEVFDMGLGSLGRMLQDDEGGIWVCGSSGVARIEHLGRWSKLGKDQGITSAVWSAYVDGGALNISVDGGVFALTAKDARTIATPIIDPSDADSSLVTRSVPVEGGRVIADQFGVGFVAEGASSIRRLTLDRSGVLAAGEYVEGDGKTYPTRIVDVVFSRLHPGMIYGFSNDFVHVLRNGVDGWQLDAVFSLPRARYASFEEMAEGVLLLGHRQGLPTLVRFDAETLKLLEARSLTADEGLGESRFSRAVLLKGVPYVLVESGTYSWAGGKFVRLAVNPFPPVDAIGEAVIQDDEDGSILYTQHELWWRSREAKDWSPLHHELPEGTMLNVLGALIGADQIVRLVAADGVFQFDPRVEPHAAPPLKLGLSALQFRGSDGNSGNGRYSGGKSVTLAQGTGVDLRFATVSLSSAPLYRWRIPGLFDTWSSWNRSGDFALRASEVGDYAVEVEAKARDGRHAATRLSYHVPPFWHQRTDVRIAGLLLALLAVGFGARELARHRTRKIALENKQLHEAVAKRSHELSEMTRQFTDANTIDPLTELTNRRAMENDLRREWVRCLDHHAPLAAIMVDIDHFAQYNEANGMLKGDELLRTLAYAMREIHDPRREVLARYDSAKFVLLLPGATAEVASRRAEGIRVALSKVAQTTTASIGVATVVPESDAEPSNLIHLTEAAVTRAQRAGRNRIEVMSRTEAA